MFIYLLFISWQITTIHFPYCKFTVHFIDNWVLNRDIIFFFCFKIAKGIWTSRYEEYLSVTTGGFERNSWKDGGEGPLLRLSGRCLLRNPEHSPALIKYSTYYLRYSNKVGTRISYLRYIMKNEMNIKFHS